MSVPPRTILVTGAAGNLGSLLSRHLAPGGHELRLMYHRTPLPEDLARAPNVRPVQADLANPPRLPGNLGARENTSRRRTPALRQNLRHEHEPGRPAAWACLRPRHSDDRSGALACASAPPLRLAGADALPTPLDRRLSPFSG